MKKVQVTNTDVAKAISGAIESNKLYPFMYRGFCSDLDTVTEEGIYDVGNEYSVNIPQGVYNYGSLLVYYGTFTVQIYVPHLTHGGSYKIAIRVKYSGEWGVWRYFTAD